MDEKEIARLKSKIKPGSLRQFTDFWEQPDAEAVRAVLELGGLTGEGAAKRLGIRESRTVRRWTGAESNISYANWALLCEIAGLGKIW
jgi:hypothetical protein